MQTSVNKWKKLGKVILWVIASLSSLLILLLLILQLGFVQTKITHYITKRLSQELKTELSIKTVNISLFNGIVISGIYLEDQQKDTLIYIDKLSVYPKNLKLITNKISFLKVSVDNLYINLYEISPDITNLQFIVDALADTTQTDTNSVFILKIGKIDIKNSRFKYKIFSPPVVDGMNFDDVDIKDFNISLKNFDLVNSDIKADIKNFSFKDKSGFAITDFNVSKFALNSKKISTEKLILITGGTYLNLSNFGFDYKNWRSFNKFMKEVNINANFEDSCHLKVSDLAYFAPELKGFDQKIYVNGHGHGTVSDLTLDSIFIRYDDAATISLSSHLQNLPHYKELVFDVDIYELSADLTAIKKLVLPGDSSPLIDFPTELANIQSISYSGRSVGSMFDFDTKGKLFSDFGNIEVDLKVERDSVSIFKINGQFTGENLNIAEVFNNSDLGNLTFSQTIDVSYLKTKKILLKTKGVIDSVSYYGYKYRNILLNADMNGERFDTLSVEINQHEIQAKFLGKLDFGTKKPEMKFSLVVDTADLKKLNLERNLKKSFLKFNIVGDFKGFSLDDFEGSIKSKGGFIYESDSLNLNLKKFELISNSDFQNGKPIKNYMIYSDFVDAKITNSGTFADFETKSQNLLNRIFPIYFDKVTDKRTDYEITETLRAKILLKEPQVITQIFYPSAKFAKNTKIDLYFGFYNDSLNVAVNSKSLNIEGINIQDYYSIFYTSKNKLNTANGGSLAEIPGGYILENVDITTSSLENSTFFDISWNNFKEHEKYSAKLKGDFNITGTKNNTKYEAKLQKSNVVISDTTWYVNESEIFIDSTLISINNLKISNNDQKIFIDGFVSERDGDFLIVDFNNFNISNFNLITGEDLTLAGKLNGTTKLVHLYKNPFIISNDSIKSLKVNDVELGDLLLKTNWNAEGEKLHVNLFNKKSNSRGNEFVKDSIIGDYWPGKDSLSFKITLNEILMKTFSNYYDEYLEFNPNSRISGDIAVFGKTSDIKYSGNIDLSRTAFKILYLNTSYTVDGKMEMTFNNKIITINETTLNSARSAGTGLLKGKIKHNNFSEIDMDIDLDVKNFQILNTLPTDSSYFYGTAFATGNINVSGSIDDMNVDINLKTDKNTNFFIPLESGESLSEENNFMKFRNDSVINPFDKENQKVKYEADLSGITMNMNLDVTPDAQIQMVMDQSTGDIIKAKGEGNLKIDIDTRGDFNMYGVYDIVEGDYLFTLKSVISKHFLIAKGGKITWQGDPYDADISLAAFYPLKKVALYNLLLEDIYREVKTKVNCDIDMSGKLMNPDIKFGVEMPEAEESISRKLESLDQEDINKQFLSLLIIGGFQPLPGLSQEAVGVTPVNSSEILTNQLNRWLSDISDEFDVGLNYQSGDQLSGDELEVALSTQLWDDRITINGNVGVGGKNKIENTSNTSNFVGEVEAELKLNKQGSFKMKVFNKANEDIISDNGPYTQGVGLFYRHEFNFFIFRPRKLKNELPDSVIKK